jgi:hypothetical protein
MLNSATAKYDYDDINLDIEAYLYFINHNLPNTDFFGPLINDLKRNIDNAYSYFFTNKNSIPNDQMVKLLEKIIDSLTSIYDQLDTGDNKNTLRTIRVIYNRILEYINKMGTEQPSLLKPKGIGEQAEFMDPGEYFEEPEIPDDFTGFKGEDLWNNDYDPYNGREVVSELIGDYGMKYVKPFLSLVPSKKDKKAFGDEISVVDNMKDMIDIKKRIKKYLYDRKISTKRAIEKAKYKLSNEEWDEGAYRRYKIEEREREALERGEFGDDDDEGGPGEGEGPTFRRPRPFEPEIVRRAVEEAGVDEEKRDREDDEITSRELEEFEQLKYQPFDVVNAYLDDERMGRFLEYTRRFPIGGFGIKSKMKGRGIGNNLAFTKEKIDITRGVKEEPRYIKFGRYLINTKKLKDGVLSLRRGTGTQIASLPVYKMSPNLSKVIKKIVGGSIPKSEDFNDLTDEEKRYLYKVSRESDLDTKIEIPTPNKDEDEKDIHQFNVYKGEIMAGNDSKELIKKFKALIVKLSKKNVLDKREVSDILETITELGH